MTDTITAFDLETSGLDTAKDHILQIGLIKFDSNTFEELGSRSWYIKPECNFEISPEAAEKTGLTKEFILANGVFLASIWDEAAEFIGNDDMLSYNGLKFDIPMLYSNLSRVGKIFDFKNRKFYDSLVIERKRNSLKLEDVYRRYTGEELEGAHNAMNDVRGLIKVFGFQKKIGTEDMEDPAFTVISPEGFVRYNEEGEVVFSTGKYRNETTNSICMKDPGYIRWVFEKFSNYTQKTIKESWYDYKMKQKEKQKS